jgi:hypothetical protein
MNLPSGDISGLIFRPVIRDDLKNVSMDNMLLAVFLELDGKRPLSEVTDRVHINMGQVRKALGRLIELGLVEPVEKATSMLDADFISFLKLQLSYAIGPIADIILEETAETMDCSLDQIPTACAAELIENLAREISREEHRTQFKSEMVRMISSKGY